MIKSNHRLEIILLSEKLNIYSFLKITSYGCIAFHYIQNEPPTHTMELIAYKALVYKTQLDKDKEFIPEPWWISLRKAAGSVIFLFLLLGIYLFLRLKNRTPSLRQRQLDRLKERSQVRAL